MNQIILLFTFTQTPNILLPSSIFKQLPKMVKQIISDLSCDESTFKNAKVFYGLALRHTGFKSEMKFDGPSSTRKNRNIKIIWFNPPFSQNVETNTEKLFFKSLQKSFLKHHIFRNIFNLNTSKLSYNLMANLQSLIKQHNYKI